MTTLKILAAEIELNSYCNRSCSYCPNSTYQRTQQGDIKPEVLNRILNQLQALNFKGRLSFHFFGEPLLSPMLNKAIIQAKELMPDVHIVLFTNGTLLTQVRFEELLKLGVEKFIITRQEQDLNKNLPIDHWPADFFKAHLNKHFQLKTHHELILSNRGNLLKVATHSSSSTTKRPCLIPSYSLYFTLQGDVLPCFEDYLQRASMGNIMIHDLEVIWKSEAFVQFRLNLKMGQRDFHPLCANCNSLQYLPY